MAVHFPLVLATLYPLVEGLALFKPTPALNGVSAGWLFLLLGSGFVAVVSGQFAMDDAQAAGYTQAVLSTHSDFGDAFPWAVLGVVAARFGLGHRFGSRGRKWALGLALLLWPLAWKTGQTGGVLVFEHGVGVAARGGSTEILPP